MDKRIEVVMVAHDDGEPSVFVIQYDGGIGAPVTIALDTLTEIADLIADLQAARERFVNEVVK